MTATMLSTVRPLPAGPDRDRHLRAPAAVRRRKARRSGERQWRAEHRDDIVMAFRR